MSCMLCTSYWDFWALDVAVQGLQILGCDIGLRHPSWLWKRVRRILEFTRVKSWPRSAQKQEAVT